MHYCFFLIEQISLQGDIYRQPFEGMCPLHVVNVEASSIISDTNPRIDQLLVNVANIKSTTRSGLQYLLMLVEMSTINSTRQCNLRQLNLPDFYDFMKFDCRFAEFSGIQLTKFSWFPRNSIEMSYKYILGYQVRSIICIIFLINTYYKKFRSVFLVQY